jgi:hypothetical protein
MTWDLPMHSGAPRHGIIRQEGMERQWVEKTSHVIDDENETRNEDKPLYAGCASQATGSQGWSNRTSPSKRTPVESEQNYFDCSVPDRNTRAHVESLPRSSYPRNCSHT